MQNLFTFSVNQMQITISPRREIPSSNQTWQFENLQKWRFQLEKKTTIHGGFSMKPYLITREQPIFGCVPYYFLLWRRCAVAMIYPDLVQTIILTEHWTVSKTWNIPRTMINKDSQLMEYDYPLKKGSMYQPRTIQPIIISQTYQLWPYIFCRVQNTSMSLCGLAFPTT